MTAMVDQFADVLETVQKFVAAGMDDAEQKSIGAHARVLAMMAALDGRARVVIELDAPAFVFQIVGKDKDGTPLELEVFRFAVPQPRPASATVQ